MRVCIPALALFGLSACLENPGVDWKLAHKHDMAVSEFSRNGTRLRISLERKNGETRLFLANLDRKDLDSLEFALQACRPDYFLEMNGENGDLIPLTYCSDPITEAHGLAVRLEGSSEADLGPMAGDFPEELDRVRILFTSLRDSPYSPRFGSNRYGYYQGSWEGDRFRAAPESGTLRGMILRDGSFYFMLSKGGNFYAPLRGTLAGDSVVDAYYQYGWEYHRSGAPSDSAYPPALFSPSAGSPDSLRLRTRFLYHSTPGVVDTMDLRISLTPSPGLVWP